jgi:hypothetical protein
MEYELKARVHSLDCTIKKQERSFHLLLEHFL